MHRNASGKNRPIDKPAEIVAITLARARHRARELALLAGRTPLEVSLDDYEQAKRELSGESERDPKELRINAPAHENPQPVPTTHTLPRPNFPPSSTT